MKFPKVKQCCCGCTLYTGTIIIAVLFTICHLVSVISALSGTDILDEFIEEGDSNPHGSNSTIWEKSIEKDGEPSGVQTLFDSLEVANAVRSIIAIALSLLLIYATMKRSSALILPWLITETVVSVLTAIITIGISFVVVILILGHTTFGLVLMLFILLESALHWYFIIVVYSFYLEIKSTARGESRQVNYKA